MRSLPQMEGSNLCSGRTSNRNRLHLLTFSCTASTKVCCVMRLDMLPTAVEHAKRPFWVVCLSAEAAYTGRLGNNRASNACPASTLLPLSQGHSTWRSCHFRYRLT